MKTRLFPFFFLFLTFAVCLFAYPLQAADSKAERVKEKQEAIDHFYSFLLSNEEPDTFFKQRQEMLQALEKVLDLETSNRDQYFHYLLASVDRYYSDLSPEKQKTLLEDAKTFYEKYRKNEQDSSVCEDCLEAIQILPVAKKLRKMSEHLPWSERKELLDELYRTMEPLKVKQWGALSHFFDSVFRMNINILDRRLENPGSRQELLPIFEAFSKVFESKNCSQMKFLGQLCRQRVLRIESEGKPCPWDGISFTDLDDKERKIADFRGKPLVLAFLPFEAPNIELLKDCAEHWRAQNLQILLMTTRYPNAEMKKFAEVCGIPFPVWNVQTSGVPKELNDSVPPHWFIYRGNTMLIDADGKVVKSYIDYENLVAELGKFYGVAADDLGLKSVQEKSAKFHYDLLRGKLLNIPENTTAEHMYRRFQSALTDTLTPPTFYRSFRSSPSQSLEAVAELFELADRIEKQTENREIIESMYAGMLFLLQIPASPTQEPDFAAQLLGKAKHLDLPKITAEAQAVEFGNKVRNLDSARMGTMAMAHSEAFMKLRDDIFNFAINSKGNYEPTSISKLFTTLADVGPVRVSDNKNQAQLYLDMANILEKLNEPALKNTIELFRGIANRLLLLGKEAPIEGETVDGKAFDPQAYKGKVVLVNFWRTWDGLSIDEISRIKNLYEKYHDKGFEIVSISIDENLNALKAYLEEKPLPWVCLADELAVQSGKTPMKLRYGIQGPTTFLVGRDGRVILLDTYKERLDAKLAEIFDE